MPSSSSHQEPVNSELEDPFRRLPDELLLVIINKLFQAKSLIRLSLVSKRFFSLVFHSHSVFVDWDFRDGPSFVGRLFGFLKKWVTRTSTPTILDSNTQKLNDILQPFQQIKHLHVRLSYLDSADQKSLENDTFFRWVAAFGSHFEFLQVLFAQSVNRSIPNPCVASAGAVDVVVTQGLNDERCQGALKLLETSVLKIASRGHDMIREHVLGLENLESVVVSNDYGQVVMGKEQIARLRSSTNTTQEQGVLDSDDVAGVGCYVPTLDLLESGYTMKDVIFFQVINGVNQEKVVGAVIHPDENVEVSVLDDSGFKHWQGFGDALRLLMNEEMQMEIISEFTQ